ncbi:YheV family putative zinc ribbon protein [Porticoccus sp. W117]|uniref:YheV family putative zinc ribbon protein n=1 Tax=Porticoccus sp. W117 TaxID=3054777 RepID=UPI0025989465|nr:YheV family putative zinc ribbon protein [Porticoccus sp. W117]MDM3870829.1 YheV family putative zinc ribbon protein [Porticoccus sp. W117]
MSNVPGKSKPRFIAGAVCPRCGEMDKTVAYKEEEENFRECVSCGFKEQLRLQAAPRELDTRVNRSEEEKQRETSVVRLIDPAADG